MIILRLYSMGSTVQEKVEDTVSHKPSKLTHVKDTGEVSMVDVSHKPAMQRQATAQAVVFMARATRSMILSSLVKKGDVLSAARLAGIQAAKQCSQLIPLCHFLPLSLVDITLYFSMAEDDEAPLLDSIVDDLPDEVCLRILASCKTCAQTGVEMEALTGASVAALTVYDMCKGVDGNLRIGGIQLKEKSKLPI